ncbi:hypothetical protein FOXYS1_13383 [Fusarium oxysporum]|uniref:Protein kinase domain-containing protein n=1 Tax=Fusarium oxysporum TaxID=5507 RepID=A0A8H5ED77_FUSOX|nr:hypothetical protein FOXYS1_13383 [Fusarium oxysporum]
MVASNPPKNRTGVLWFSSQMCGLMGALDTIHDPKHLHLEQGVIRKYGRHGDIKCDNILCFQKSGTTNEKILVISDFGLSAFNSDKSRSNIPNGKVPPVPGYRPPECDIEGGTVSRAFDIWTLGCLFLDFVTWFLGGHGYLAEFKRKRKTPFINGAVNDIFFTIKSLEKKKMEEKATYVALVKPEVTEWILTLRQHPNCSPFLHKALDLIEQDMLIVLSTEKKRSLSSKLLDDFEEISRRCQSQKGYVKGKPWGNDELRDARERMAQNITAVEIVPNETALALIRDHNRLPVHSGKSMKSIGPAQYKALERPEK